ncbi:MAG: hypothetical protein HY904_20460 [Deltaproteobacteria bacterium]|nr:hypothetical protein [Deltaproteobacteria bacterium]
MNLFPPAVPSRRALRSVVPVVVLASSCTAFRVEECQSDAHCASDQHCNTDLGRCQSNIAATSSSLASSSRRASSSRAGSSSALAVGSSSGGSFTPASSGVSSPSSLEPSSSGVAPDAGVPAEVRRVFVTSQDVATSVGGLSGADAICQGGATAAGLGGLWKAWLSDSRTSAAARLVHHPGPYLTTAGVTVADSWEGLVSGALRAPIDRDEFGQPRNRAVFTNTNPDGTARSPTDHCADWSAAGSDQVSFAGSSVAADGAWTLAATNPYSCLYAFALYCVEQ